MQNAHLHKTKLTAAISIVLFLASCSSANEMQSGSMELVECGVGSECIFEGEMTVHRRRSGAVGVLELSDGQCVSLALPNEIYLHKKRWINRPISVRGEAFFYKTEIDVLSYELGGRWVLTGACETDLILYVKQIQRKKSIHPTKNLIHLKRRNRGQTDDK